MVCGLKPRDIFEYSSLSGSLHVMVLERSFSSCWLDLASLCTHTHAQKRSLSLSDSDAYFLTVWLMLKSSVKMCRNVSYDKLLTARTLSVLRRLSTWVTWRALSTFRSVRLDNGRPEHRTRRTKHWNKRHWNGRGMLLYNLPGISDFSPISFRTLGFTSGFEYSTPARDGWSTFLVQSLLRSW